MDKKITDLESRIALLEASCDELSKAVYERDAELQRLQQQLQILSKRQQSLLDNLGDEEAERPENNIPPHY